MNKIIEKCDVCINGSVVSKELLIKTFSSFVSSTIEDKQHNVGIVLHTGSVCFDAILFWKESQVALFTSDNEECYAAAKNSDIRCIYCADDTVTVRKILDVLKEQ